MIIHITIPIVPKPQARDRIAVVGGHARSYKTKAQKLEEDKLLTMLLSHRPPEPLQGPISLNVVVYLPMPKKSRIWQEKALKGEIRPTPKPDCSNMLKNIEDIMEGPFYRNDSQIVDASISKFYGTTPRWEITLKADY